MPSLSKKKKVAFSFMHFVVPTYLRFKSKFCRIIEKKMKKRKKQQKE